jgi:ribosomal protein S18 acetylase RimI-like enzyme
MIEKLKNKEPRISEKIREIFQQSYKIEAEILKATDFPPLKRTLENFINSDTDFYAYIINNQFAGVIEIDKKPNHIHIQSLVVNPLNFRQGVASKLMNFILTNFETNLFVVETGLKNEPATILYKKFGFKEVKQWDTNHGIRKVKFELLKK